MFNVYSEARLTLLLAALAGAGPALAEKSASDGAYGGYVGSSRQLQSEMDSARQRANLERSLGKRESTAQSGVEIELRIAFPAAQQGLANLTTVTLEPTDAGAHAALALATVDSANRVNASFGARKDVKAGHSYRVVLEDSRGGKYPVGKIRVERKNGPQRFHLAAPLLGSGDSPPAETTAVGGESPTPAAPSAGAGYVAPSVGPGYVAPRIGEGYVRPGSAK